MNRIAQLRFEQQAAGRQRIPEPNVFAGLKRTEVGAGRPAGAVIGISIPLPVFNKGQAEVARINAESERAGARKEGLVQQISAAVLGAYDLLAARIDVLRTFERNTGDAGAELLRIAKAGYQDGALGVLELLDAYRLTRLTGLRRLEFQGAVKDAEIELSRNAGFEVMQ